MNNADMNIHVQDFVYLFASLGYIPSTGIGRSYGYSLFKLPRIIRLFSTMAVYFIFLPEEFEDFDVSTLLPTISIICLF